MGHFLPLFNKAARKQSATSSICSENLEHLPLGARAVARETPPWGNHPSLITGGGQAGDTFFFLAMPWGQLLPSDLKKLREKEKRPSLTPPFRPQWSATFGWLYFFIVFLHFVFPPARPFTVCRSRFSHSPFTRLRPRRCACLIPRPLAVETAHRLNDPVRPAPGASVASEEAPRRPAWRRQARAEQIGKGS